MPLRSPAISEAEYTVDRRSEVSAAVMAGSVAERLEIHGIKAEPAPGGVFVPLPLNTLAMIVTGALAEACLLVADAEDQEAARTETLSVVLQLLEGLRTGA